jgi:predicted DCC family thiol-disulfide oxidoreductase YuxK
MPGRLAARPLRPCHTGPVSERLVFDGDCGFCTTSANWLARGDRVVTVPWQFLDLDTVGLTVDQVSSSVWWLVDDRPVEHSSRAIGRALLLRGAPWSWAGRVLMVPAVRPLADAVYRVVARYRHQLPGGTPACRMPR